MLCTEDDDQSDDEQEIQFRFETIGKIEIIYS